MKSINAISTKIADIRQVALDCDNPLNLLSYELRQIVKDNGFDLGEREMEKICKAIVSIEAARRDANDMELLFHKLVNN